jgi:hypothetical protein
MPIETWETPHSSNVSRISFDPDTRELTVTFRGGSAYVLNGVDATTASDFANDPSPGGYYNRNLRSRYTARKL